MGSKIWCEKQCDPIPPKSNWQCQDPTAPAGQAGQDGQEEAGGAGEQAGECQEKEANQQAVPGVEVMGGMPEGGGATTTGAGDVIRKKRNWLNFKLSDSTAAALTVKLVTPEEGGAGNNVQQGDQASDGHLHNWCPRFSFPNRVDSKHGEVGTRGAPLEHPRVVAAPDH